MKNRKIKINLKNPERIKDFLKTVEKYKSDIDIMTDRATIDAKSIIGIFALDLTDDIYVQIISDNVAECRKFEAEMEQFR
ncbi:HPr family phosphocarrier protein [Thomasclavelia cocleata]|jgi:phosphotransferase system HPr-like phosphotransfer protein|uniref:HPr family phosphocarrier protein n=1 Tax=Thomasclavelia cocleata TaxID=69824 RepID=UPI00255AD75C|nr:HPr family phosphocarrier protein [Thomasclavelia cocleata]